MASSSLKPPLETQNFFLSLIIISEFILIFVPGLSITLVLTKTFPETINPRASCLVLTSFFSRSNLSILIFSILNSLSLIFRFWNIS